MKKVVSTNGQLRSSGRLKARPGAERLEADGQTHRRDCECPRCEAGFTPTDHDRELAARRVAEKQGRAAAARAWGRKKERTRLAQLDLQAYFRAGNAAADAEVQRLREMRNKAIADRRLDELLRLRREGLPLGLALDEIDRRFPPEATGGAENDNAHPIDGAPRPRVARTGSLFS